MEPGFNPVLLEKQAIGRVHRLGQKRNVEIIRLLFVKDSIETRIRKFLETKYGTPSSTESKKEAKKSGDCGSQEFEAGVIENPIGNLATERPKNKMVLSEFDMLFGFEPSDSEDPKRDFKIPLPSHNLFAALPQHAAWTVRWLETFH